MDQTSRLQLLRIVADPANPTAADLVSALRTAINDHANKLDTAGIFIHGDAGDRPPAGIPDRYFYAEDTGVLSRDTGTGWEDINAPTTSHLADVYANRPPAGPALNGVRFFAIDKGMEWQCIAGAWVLVGTQAPEVSALPAGPIDQQQCVLILDAAAGVKTRLRYRAASTSAYKWEVEGESPPIVSESTVNEGAQSGSWSNTTPALTVPFSGDWDIEVYSAQIGADTAQAYAQLSYAAGANPPAAGDGVTVRAEVGGADGFKTGSMRRRQSGLAAGTLLKQRFQVTAGVGYATGNSTMPHGLRAWPVRLG